MKKELIFLTLCFFTFMCFAQQSTDETPFTKYGRSGLVFNAGISTPLGNYAANSKEGYSSILENGFAERGMLLRLSHSTNCFGNSRFGLYSTILYSKHSLNMAKFQEAILYQHNELNTGHMLSNLKITTPNGIYYSNVSLLVGPYYVFNLKKIEKFSQIRTALQFGFIRGVSPGWDGFWKSVHIGETGTVNGSDNEYFVDASSSNATGMGYLGNFVCDIDIKLIKRLYLNLGLSYAVGTLSGKTHYYYHFLRTNDGYENKSEIDLTQKYNYTTLNTHLGLSILIGKAK